MSYDISQYTDEQCFELLDLNSPSDRELEMKILQQLDKYETKSKRLYRFFEQMYDRFFDVSDEEEDDNNSDALIGSELIEGFASDAQTSYNGVPIDRPSGAGTPVPNLQANPNIILGGTTNGDTIRATDQMQQTRPGGAGAITTGAEGNTLIKTVPKDVANAAKTTNTRVVDYVKDKLNPVSRKTMFKMISIDSQYREDSQNTSATNFSLNLSENLANVISMKLYSVQIPYTWYTINNNFGSNYFYLKGNSQGIDNGQHDVKVQIPSGTYTSQQIATTINTSISALKLKSTNDSQFNSIYDLSFGQTVVSYNTADVISSKILFEFDLKKIFNETDYSLYFPNWTTPNVEGNDKSNSIPSFLGYNNNTYLPYIARSDASANYYTLGDNFTITSSNNSFNIIQYTYGGIDRYADNSANCTVINNINISIGTGTYTRAQIIAAVNTAMQSPNSNLDDIYSFFRLTDITDITNINYGKKRIELGAKLNRKTTQQIEGSKLAIVFPDESYIWTGSSSCFRFPNKIIELNEIISETPTSITSYTIASGVKIELNCITSGYDISFNNFQTTITPTTYTVSQYTTEINRALQQSSWRDLSSNSYISDGIIYGTNDTYFDFNINSYPRFNFNILREFTESQYIIDLTQCFLKLGNIFNFDSSYSSVYTDSRIIESQTSYTINSSNNKIILISKNSSNGFSNGSGNYAANTITIIIPNITANINSFCIHINNFFSTNPIMAGSSIIPTINNDGRITITVIFNVSVKLTANDYNVVFTDYSWQTNLGLDSSYNLITANPVIGSKKVFNNIITLSEYNNNNQIIFRPVNPVLSGGDDIIITLASNTSYTRENLVSAINTAFGTNPLIAGSTLTIDSATNISNMRININKIYTSADFRLVFYDIFSFVYCNVGVSNVSNVKWDTTLGWTLGFHTYTEYALSEFAALKSGLDTPLIISANYFEDQYSNYFKNIYGIRAAADSPIASGNQLSTTNIGYYINSNSTTDTRLAIISDSVSNTNLYNYFLLVIDDFIQNHVNDGLITIASVENDVSLPTYSSRVSYQCDPITGKKVAGIGTNNQFQNLTAKQLYSMNQIIDARRSSSTYVAGPYLRDVFALIPIKLAGLTFGQTYMEFGGTLQNQDRKYFGPVNIKKLSIKLMNDKGDVVDLNGTNWSFTLICEILNDPPK